MITSFNVSMLKTFVKCPQMGHYEHILRRVSKRRSDALTQGTMWHKAMECKSQNLDYEPYVLALYPYDREVWDQCLGKIAPLVTFPKEEKVLEVEKELHLPDFCNGLPLVGRLDAIVEFQGRIWHRQYKTIAATKPLHVFVETQRVDWHECAYQRMLELAYPGREIGGTILYVTKKINKKTLESNPESAIVPPFYLTRSDEIVANALIDMEKVAATIVSMEDVWILQNPLSCAGPFGNSLCPFFNVCFENGDVMDDDLFESREERYEVQSGESGT